MQGAQTHRFGQCGRLFRREVGLAHPGGVFRRHGNHAFHQVVGIHHSAFAGFHLAGGELHHAVGEMVDPFSPVVGQLFPENQLEHVEMVVLLVAHHVDHAAGMEFVVAGQGGAEILRHVYGGAV